MSKSDVDNRSNQLNPNNDAYYESRGYEGREDYYGDDCEYVGPYITNSSPGPKVLSFEQKEQRFLDQRRKSIASSMTTGKASEILWNLLLHDFPEIEVDLDFYGGDIRVTVTGCLPGSETAQSIEATTNAWLKDRQWLISGCVEGVQLTFKF
ncbi:hypothetical protein MD273_14140 [Marinobacter pelagius]|uniref:hypothetical protein n=1 Tax=Marinobacter sp. C7 TaxID=2951363 RepID=UPI001EF138DB|nr:hypothetical protein [Marinobacter sp. C7]MCG7200872.1 hypothetical protein [Marinobacter sp. C7]